MKFYMTPGSCSTGIHILLEELDLPFEVYLVNLLAGDQHRDDYLALNPKGTIPILVRDDGSVLSEFQAIAWWLARTHPRANLLPADSEGETRVIEAMDYAVGTVHMQGFTRLFTTASYTPNEADHPAVKQRGLDIVTQGYGVFDRLLAGREYLWDRFSIADAALFYVEFWGDKLKLDLPENLRAHYQRLLGRPAVQRVLREEGYRL